MKRFTESTKWRDPWFRKLSPQSKLLFLYILDNCDHSGVLDLDIEAASFDAGISIERQHLDEISSRVETLVSGKIWVKGFVKYQYGELRKECRPHIAVVTRLKFHGINLDRVS